MSAVCILAPVVIAGWPAFSAAVMAAATSLGYQVASEMAKPKGIVAEEEQSGSVSLEIPRSEVVTSQLGRDQRMSVTREGLTGPFSRDARGKAALCVTGSGQDDATLRALGDEHSNPFSRP